jgi:hypothetical protein
VTSENLPAGMEHRANAEWETVPDHEPAPRLADGRFVDPDDGTPVWYTIPFRGPDHEFTAGELRALRGDAPPPPVVGPLPPFTAPDEPVELPDDSAPEDPRRSRNVTPDGTPHFARLLPPSPGYPQGRTVCGGDGKDWPCDDAPQSLDVQVQNLADGRPPQRSVELETMAASLGVSVETLEATVYELDRRQRERTGESLRDSVHRAEDEGRRYVQ